MHFSSVSLSQERARERGSLPKEMFDTYSKRLKRFFEFLVNMNNTISNQQQKGLAMDKYSFRRMETSS